jgi:alpha-glucosidase
MISHALPWWQQGVIYQVYPRSFKDSNGDGIGDLQGIIDKLGYLSWLGIDAMWISPFYPSPMADFGYDIMDYCDVDPLFGDLNMFDTLVEEAHRHNIKVIIDFVPNHTSDQHPWFSESRQSRSDARRDWYMWADAKADGSPPNNWLSILGGSSAKPGAIWKAEVEQVPPPLVPAGTSWKWDEATQQYYLHSFLEQQPDLNWRNRAVRVAMFDVLRFWLERGVDGFRIDVANFILKDPLLRDNPPNMSRTVIHKSRGDYDSQLHIHDRGHPDVHGVLRELRSLLDGYNGHTPRVAIGELAVFTLEEWAGYYGANLDELHIPFNFSFLGATWNAEAIRRIVDATEAIMPVGAWPNYVLGNHDEPRVASRFGKRSARSALMLMLTLRGTPFLYYGDELGMRNVVIPPERIQDPQEKNVPGLGLGRDPSRTPMQWDASPSAGFCPPDVEPWLPLADDYQQVNVAVEREDPFSMLTFTRELLALRRSRSALNRGSYSALESGSQNCFAYLRNFDDERVVVALNTSDEPQLVRIAEDGEGRILLSTSLKRKERINLGALILEGQEGCVIELLDSLPHLTQ